MVPLRAAGAYLSEAEAAALVAHARFLTGGSSGGAAAAAGPEEPTVDFAAFLALYVNHRPRDDGVTEAELEAAFDAIAASFGTAGGGGGLAGGGAGALSSGGSAVPGRAFAQALMAGGEALSPAEFDLALRVLLARGAGGSGGGSGSGNGGSVGSSGGGAARLPERLTAAAFAADVLGLRPAAA